MKLHKIQQKPAQVIISSFPWKGSEPRRTVSLQMSVCDTLLPAGPHWQAHVIPVTFSEPSHFIRTVINHRRNNVVAWNTGAATVLRRRASAARGLLGARQGATGKALPWWSLSRSIEDHHPTVTSVGIAGCNSNPRAGFGYSGCSMSAQTMALARTLFQPNSLRNH